MWADLKPRRTESSSFDDFMDRLLPEVVAYDPLERWTTCGIDVELEGRLASHSQYDLRIVFGASCATIALDWYRSFDAPLTLLPHGDVALLRSPVAPPSPESSCQNFMC